jgi:predicted outer membrane repeat protein
LIVRTRGAIALVAAFVVALAVPGAAKADIHSVNNSADGGDGLCQTTPGACTLRDAVADAAAGDTINVPAGSYVLSSQLGELGIGVDVTIVGAGARQTIISGNQSSKIFYIFGADVTMTGVTLTRGNGVGEINGSGGAVYVDSGSSLALGSSAVTNSTVIGAGGSGDGGGIYSAGRLVVAGTTVSGNTATGNGGAVYSTQPEFPTFILTSTLSGNSATATGGGIYVSGPLGMTYSTVANNSARLGGGIFKPAGSLAVSDTIVVASGGGACGGQITSNTGSHNISNDATCPFGSPGDRTNVDPLLGPLQDNTGPTDTHALLVGSPAIGAANPASCSGNDQRGVPRPQEGICDIGAFEYVPPPSPLPGPPPPEDEELPPPVAGQTVNALPKSGRVRIRLPGTRSFVRLRVDQQVPIGTVFDTRNGHVTLVAAANRQGGTATAEFWAGIFRLGQTRGRRPITILTLAERLSCPRTSKAITAAKRKKRRLWGNGSGKFRTKGKHSAATVVGTKWLVQDRCSSTLTRVVRGRVKVRDFARKKTVTVRAGNRYVARAG